jgi:transcriptional regulator
VKGLFCDAEAKRSRQPFDVATNQTATPVDDASMYLPEHFRESRTEALHALMREHPFGMLVTHSAQGLDADHLPFELDCHRGPLGTLQTHIARANPLRESIPSGTEVMVVFRGPHGYISPGWYPSKHETGRQVPTWNYEVVHAHGTLRIVDDEKFVRGLVARLTRRHEAGQAKPWKMGDAPREYLDRMLTMIIGVEVHLTRLEGKRKLSQNKEPRDRDGVVKNLRERAEHDLASSVAGTIAESASQAAPKELS